MPSIYIGLGHTNATVSRAKKNNFFDEKGLKIQDISSGIAAYHHFVLTQDGKVYATGNNSGGQLGLEDKRRRNEYTKVSYFNNRGKSVQQVACCHTYSIFLSDGDVYAVGHSDHGGLGMGPKVTSCESIAGVLYGKKIVQIAGGYVKNLYIFSVGRSVTSPQRVYKLRYSNIRK